MLEQHGHLKEGEDPASVFPNLSDQERKELEELTKKAAKKGNAYVDLSGETKELLKKIEAQYGPNSGKTEKRDVSSKGDEQKIDFDLKVEVEEKASDK